MGIDNKIKLSFKFLQNIVGAERVLVLWSFVGVATCGNKLALRRKTKSLHAKSHSSSYSFRDLSVHKDRRAWLG